MESLLGLLPQRSGKIELFGEENSRSLIASKVGFLPQSQIIDRQFPITVRELIDIECGQGVSCPISAEDHLAVFNAQQLIDNKISDLSGGEFQKVLIARALIKDPQLLILDEPTNNLHPDSVTQLFRLLKSLTEQGKAVVVVIHDHNVIENYPGRIFEFAQGRVVELNSVAELHRHD